MGFHFFWHLAHPCHRPTVVEKDLTEGHAELAAAPAVLLLVHVWVRGLHVPQVGQPRGRRRPGKGVEEQVRLARLARNGKPVRVGPRCRWVLSGWIFGWWGHLVPRLGQTIAQAELRRLPGSGGSWLAWVGWHRPSRVSPQLRLRSPQLASPPSDTSRDSQFESASSKCEPPPRGWFIGRFMAQEWVYWPNNGHCSPCHTK